MVGKKMVALVPPGEQVSFFIPVFVKVDGKSRPGGLLYTDKHVIVGYTEGAMRLSTSYARAILLAAITSSPMSKEEIGPFAPKSPSITVHSPEFSFDAIFNAPGTNRPIFAAAASILPGFATVDLGAEGEAKGLNIDTNVPSFTQNGNEAKVI